MASKYLKPSNIGLELKNNPSLFQKRENKYKPNIYANFLKKLEKIVQDEIDNFKEDWLN